MQSSLSVRPRRLRSSPALREMVRETFLRPSDLVMPLFVHAGMGVEEVASMPDVKRWDEKGLVEECKRLEQLGIRAVATFPCVEANKKDAQGSEALNADNLLNRAVRAVKKACPQLLVMTDVALDPYTSHGHDGVLTADGKDVDNDATVEILARMAVLQAGCGSDAVAPSDMMDGRVAAIRKSLDAQKLHSTLIISYSAKYASAYYAPFRDAIGSQRPAGTYLDKGTYQMDSANTREAIKEVLIDVEEGADVVMVKPAGPYLDVIRAVKEEVLLPVAAYQVSGEYAQIHAAARLGWLNLEAVQHESLLAIKRAGADMILTYFAAAVAPSL